MAPLLALGAAAIAAALNLFTGWMLSRSPIEVRRYQAEPSARLLVGIFALLYVGAFAWLQFGNIDQGEWSRTILWLTPLAFIGPWSIDAIGVAVYVVGRRRAIDDYFSSASHRPSREAVDDL